MGKIVFFGFLGSLVGTFALFTAIQPTDRQRQEMDYAFFNIELPKPESKPKTTRPKLIVPEFEFDFGKMGPSQTGSHDFVVRNEGNGELELRKGGMSCSCIGVELHPEKIGPGEEGIVRVEWETKVQVEGYRQRATIRTNDPERPAFDLDVFGNVLHTFSAHPKEVVFTKILPGRVATADIVLFSEDWEEFEIKQITPSSSNIEVVDLGTVPPISITGNAKLARKFQVKTSDAIPPGRLLEQISFQAESTSNPGETRTVVVPISGTISQTISFYGEHIDRNGVVSMGRVLRRNAKEIPVNVKVNDEITSLSIKSITCSPNVLETRLVPHERIRGLYQLVFSIPEDAEERAYQGRDAIQVEVEFDHPRSSPRKFQVEVIVHGS